MSSEDVKATSRMLRQISDPHTRRLFELTLLNIDILKDSLSALENPLNPEWINLELQNGWVQIAAIDAVLPKYFKNKFNQVFIRGVISSGTTTNGTTIFELPAGHRPSKIEPISILEDTGLGDAHLHIHPTGIVTIERVTTNAELSIECSFYAES